MSAITNKLTLNPLLQQYLSLSHIIYRKKYLIPQRPLPPQPLTISANLSQTYLKYFPEIQNNHNLQKQLPDIQLSELIKLLKQRQKAEKQQYNKKLLKYQQKYLIPIQTYQKAITPYQLYYRDQKMHILNSLKQKNKRFQINMILQYYNTISNESKLKYQQQSQKLNNQMKILYQPIIQRYRIPQLSYKSTINYYHMEQEKDKIPLQKYKIYKQLSEDQKDQLDKKCHRYNMEIEDNFRFFLKRNKISMKKFKEIMTISTAITKQLKKNKHSKLAETESIIHHQYIPQKQKQIQNNQQLQHSSTQNQPKRQQTVIQQKQKEQTLNLSSKKIDENIIQQQQIKPKKSIPKRPEIDIRIQGQFSQEQYLQHDEEQLLLQRQIKKTLLSLSRKGIENKFD